MQKIPDDIYKKAKRNSVFHKVDLAAFDLDTIPEFKKTEQEIQEIYELLGKLFLSKNLEPTQLRKIAGLMEPKEYKKGECIIRYGDDGTSYYVLSKGNVEVTVY